MIEIRDLGEIPDLRVDVGRCDQGTFVRVVHLSTGKSCVQAGLGDRTADDVAKKLAMKLLSELQAEGMGFEPT